MNYKSIPLGALESPRDDRDHKLSSVMTDKELKEIIAKAPVSFTVSNLTPVYNQSVYGQCVAFSVAKIKEIQELIETKVQQRFSTSFVYLFRDKIYEGEGMYLRQALKQLVKNGICRYELFPELYHYSEKPTINEKPLYLDAVGKKIKSYVRLNTEEEMQAYLMKYNTPILMAMTVFNSFYETNTSGIIPVASGASVGGHSMIFCGWKVINGKRYWILQNHWGEEWGASGFAYLNMQDYPINEAWGVIDTNPTEMASLPNEIKIKIGSNKMTVDDIEILSDAAPFIQKETNRTFVPIRVISQLFGYKVIWNPISQTVTIKRGGEILNTEKTTFEI